MSNFVKKNRFGNLTQYRGMKKNKNDIPTCYMELKGKIYQFQLLDAREKGEAKGFCNYLTCTETDFTNTPRKM